MTIDQPAARPLRPRDPRLGPWRAFVIAHARVWRRLDEDLRVEHGLSLSEYEALLLLAEAPDRRLRMRGLAEDLQLSKSGVTRLVDRLVDDGYVQRGLCTTDARGAEAVLTSGGLDRLRSAAPTHLRGIQEYFLDALDERDLDAIERSMRAVADSLPNGPFRAARTRGDACEPTMTGTTGATSAGDATDAARATGTPAGAA